MKSFSNFLLESQQWGSGKAVRSKEEEMEVAKMSPIFKKFALQGWTFEATIHAAAQAYDRRPGFEVDDWKKMHRSVLEAIKKNKSGDGEYLFFSKSADQAYIAAVKAKQKMVRIITVLPKGKSFPLPGTEKLIVEGIAVEIKEIIEVD